MNVHDIPMVLFTVLSQTAVGTFITLGLIQNLMAPRHDPQRLKRVLSPILYAIGPILVLGLAVSMLHMNDITHTFNVIRHWDSSWLSREILFGVSFAGFGFLFALLEWFEKGSYRLRQVVAIITALLGIGLLVAESMIYYSLITVPAWHSPAVPFQFFATAGLMGVLTVSAALVITAWVRNKAATTDKPAATGGSVPETEPSGGLKLQIRTRVAEINAPTTDEEWELTRKLLKVLSLVGAIIAVSILVFYPVYITSLALGGATAQASAAVFASPLFWIRLILDAATAILLGFFVYRMAGDAKRTNFSALTTLVIVTLVLALSGELMGRMLHYLTMVRVGL